MRLLAGFTSAVVFAGAVNWMADHLHHHSPHLTGWGFGGVGVGIALSGSLVLLLPGATGWKGAWWVAGGLAAVLSVGGVGSCAPERGPRRDTERPHRHPRDRPRVIAGLPSCCSVDTLEGIDACIAGTFIVAAIASTTPLAGLVAVRGSSSASQRLRQRCCGHGWVGASRIRCCWRRRLVLQAGGIVLAGPGLAARPLLL